MDVGPSDKRVQLKRTLEANRLGVGDVSFFFGPRTTNVGVRSSNLFGRASCVQNREPELSGFGDPQ